MRAPNCFILYSIIITVLLNSSGLVMGVPAGLPDNVLNGVPMLLNQLRDIETQLNALQQSSHQQAQQISIIQDNVGGLLKAVETVAAQLNVSDVRNDVQPQDISGAESQGIPPSNPVNPHISPEYVNQYSGQLMDMANSMAKIREKIVI